MFSAYYSPSPILSSSRKLTVTSQTFLYFLSLRTGVEMIALSVLFNKLTGFYGLLAILTGLQLSPLQISMYIYSVLALILLAFLMPHIRKQSPFQNLALAWFYAIDTVVNTGFTAAFAVTWFLAVSADHHNKSFPTGAPGGGMINDAAGFTSPKHNVSQVDVVVNPSTGQEAVGLGAGSNPSLSHAVGIEESIPSIVVVVILTLIRVYFILVVMSYARQVLRSYMFSEGQGTGKLHLNTDGVADVTKADNPFADGAPLGDGWRGKLGRVMVKVGEGYWLGGRQDEDWVKGLDGRFKTGTKLASGPPGTVERERRARSGTGPPKVPKDLVKS
jgi:hypothetical protein